MNTSTPHIPPQVVAKLAEADMASGHAIYEQFGYLDAVTERVRWISLACAYLVVAVALISGKYFGLDVVHLPISEHQSVPYPLWPLWVPTVFAVWTTARYICHRRYTADVATAEKALLALAQQPDVRLIFVLIRDCDPRLLYRYVAGQALLRPMNSKTAPNP